MTRYALHIICLLLIISVTTATSQVCGTVISPEDAAQIDERNEVMRHFNARSTRGIRDFPIQVHIARRSDGTGGISITEVEDAIRGVNSYFINANVRFVILDKIHFLDNNKHYNFNTSNEKSLAILHDEPQVINLYLFNSIVDAGMQLCGYAHYPNQLSYKRNNDRILMRNSCAINGSTLVHEFGHFFSLYHTHGNRQMRTAKELVTRHEDLRNCETAGDGLCDTPADPGLINKVDRSCKYIGSERDAMGFRYRPDPTNIMAYSPTQCRDDLTQEQYNRINYMAHHWRSYLRFPEDFDTQVASNDEKPVSPPVPTTKPEAPKPKPKYAKISGELALEINGQRLPVKLEGNMFKGTETYYSGTTYEVAITNDDQVYVYAFASDLTKQSYQLYPQTGNTAFVAAKDKKVLLPGNGQVFAMDETVGKDYLCILYSQKPLDIGYVTRRMQYENGNFVQRLYKTLGTELVTTNKVRYSRSGRIQFYANTTERDVVPIILELNHQ
ncbi:MAG: M43 family zinc metalloprotease [Bacteroidota bacterium]